MKTASHVFCLILLTVPALAAPSGPFSPEDWPPSKDNSKTVHYVVADPNQAFAAPGPSWTPDSLQILTGGDQVTEPITIGGHTGVKVTGNFLNIADSSYQDWADKDTIDILMQVHGDSALLNANSTPRNFRFLTGTLPPADLSEVPGGSIPVEAKNKQWNWVLFRIANGTRPDGGRYVGTLPSDVQGMSQNGGVNSGTIRMQGVPNLIVRVIAFGEKGAFGETNQINVFATGKSCDPEPATNLAFIDINSGTTNHLLVLNSGDQTVTFQANVGPASDKRRAVKANGDFMNFGITDDYLGKPCNDPRAMKVAVEFYDDPALTGAVFGPEAYAIDDSGNTNVFPAGRRFTTTGTGQWSKLAFVVPAVDLAGINTSPLTGGPRLIFDANKLFFSRIELGVFRTGTNALAGLDPAPGYFEDPNVCMGIYGNYAELDLQNNIKSGLDVGTSGGDQLMVVETAGPPNDQRLSVRPDGKPGFFLNFQILTNALGPSTQDNARLAICATYFDDPALTNAVFRPEVYQSEQGGNLTLAFTSPNIAVRLQGTGRWRDAYFEIPDVRFNGVNQGPQAAARFITSGPVHITRLRYAVIRPCGPQEGVNLLAACKPVADFGDTVSGFQDDFNGPVRDPNWKAFGTGGDLYEQFDGVLHVSAHAGDPNHLLFMAPGYSNNVQEVLARIRVTAFGPAPGGNDPTDAPRGGIAVGVQTNSTELSRGLNLHFRDHNQDNVPGRQFKFLDDARAWGPPGLTNIPPQTTPGWTNNVWYWMRIRLDSKVDGTNSLFGKVWAADSSTPEPSDWRVRWKDSALPKPLREGFVGIAASSADGLAHLEVDYILIKASGLPQIKVNFNPTGPPATAPSFRGINNIKGNKFELPWVGAGSLEEADEVSGPWTAAKGITGTITADKSRKFYRLRQ